MECIVLPTGSVSETRVGIGSRRDFIFSCFRNSAGEAYRSRYTYFSNLFARMRLPVLRKMSG